VRKPPSVAPAAGDDEIPTLAPLGGAPKSAPGLTPVAGLTPLEGLAPLGGETKIGGVAGGMSLPPGITPLPPEPLAGLAPLPEPLPEPLPADDPLASLPAANPLGFSARSLNPFAATVGNNPAAFAPRPRPFITDRDRRGLEWEREASFDAYWDTVWEAIRSPHDAFQAMRRRGGFGNPMGFFLVSIVLGQIFLLIEVALLSAGSKLLLGQQIDWAPFFIGLGILATAMIFSAIVNSILGSFFGAALLHLGLALVGGAHAGFEATYRVHAYGHGSVYLLLAVPIVGPFFYFVMYFVVLIYGLMFAHETSGPKATFAVLFPTLLAGCCFCPVLFLLTGGPALFGPLAGP
jgi:hypothetical protein